MKSTRFRLDKVGDIALKLKSIDKNDIILQDIE